MLQTARQPRHLALLALATVFAVVFVALGFWQYGVAQQDAREEALREGPRQPIVALDELVAPYEPFPSNGSLRRVTTSGTYDADQQFLVPGRVLEGERGYWVVAPVVVDTTGARLPILRGFVTDPDQAAPPPAGKVRITGALAPSDSPVDVGPLPPGQRGSIEVATLINEWGGEVYNAFLFVIAQDPAEPTSAMQPVPPPAPEVDGLDWRNLGYALQWWVFALFAYYLWWRSVREDHLDEVARQEAAHSSPPPESPPGDHPAPDVPEGTHV
ncbi:SURF1 family protein [Demetria terragena]|uniref:SURF1 family protein n=1 Tax=Demetria terragena TaxID=63959 RepID=UPI0003728A13|nr:SURF1 family protein [Demetria terragena]